MDGLVVKVEGALRDRRQLLPRGFSSRRAARRIAVSYLDASDGASRFWIARARWTGADGRPAVRAIYEVLRADGHVGVWDASTLAEGELIADVLTALSL